MAKVGLKNIVVAKIVSETAEATTYDTVRKISKAMTANVTPNVNSATLYGDDQAQETIEELADVTVEVGINDLSNEDYAYIMGKTVDENGGVTDSVTDEAPYLALGYEVPLTKGRKRVTWLYKGKFGLPSETDQTKQGATSFQTPTISARFIPREDGKWRYRVESTETNSAVIKTFLDSVKEAPVPTP
jgi:phi13 family phage major tail protein